MAVELQTYAMCISCHQRKVQSCWRVESETSARRRGHFLFNSSMGLLRWSAFLLLLLNLNGCHLLSVSKPEDNPSSMADDELALARLLDVSEAGDIESACPMKDTFCVPRVKCPVKNVVYDRESLRFILTELFKDQHACGAFSPTWTYVCCSSLDKADVGAWTPTMEQWFLPPVEGAPRSDAVDINSAFPVMKPWPSYKSNSTVNGTATNSTKNATNSDKLKAKNDSSSTTEKPKTSERSVMNDQTQQQNQPFPSFSMENPFMLNNWMNPMMMNQARMVNGGNSMFGQNNNFMQQDPAWLMQQRQQQLAQQQMWSQPQQQQMEWTQMILIFPDGSTTRTFRDPPRSPQQSFSGNMMDPMMDPARRPPVPLPQKSDIADSSMDGNPSIRIRRSATETSKAFKMQFATGGMWTGNQTANKTDAEGRALLPKPNAQWGLPPGSGPVPNVPIPPAFNVNNDRCGISASIGINARVLSGRTPGSQVQAETSFGEFPWHVAIVNGETGDYLCAGTIISARFVITVAHCVRKFQLTLLFVRVGDWDLSSTKEMLPSYDVEVNRVQVHEEYNAGNMENDIALLQLKFPLDFSVMPHVGPVCLPPSSDPIYSDCVVTGWGQQLSTTEAKGDTATFSRTLKQTSQTLVTAQFCEKSLRPFLGQFYQLPKRGFLCAYDKDGKDSCFGDGGGALACLVNAPNYPKPTQYHVVGLVSWGIGCGMPAVPSAYTAIWDYLDWIRARVNPIDPYPVANPDPLNRASTPPTLPIMVRSNIDAGADSKTSSSAPSTTTMKSTTKPTDFIDLAFRN